MPADGLATEPTSAIFDPVAARAEHMVPPDERALSKKEEWLREKALRPDFRISENELARAANPSTPARRRRARSSFRPTRRTGPNRWSAPASASSR